MRAVFRYGAVFLAAAHLAVLAAPGAKDVLQVLMALASLAVLVPGLFLMGKGFRKATFVFLAAGTLILALTGQPFEAWVKAVNSMTNTVAIMVTLQLFTIPVAAGRYDEAIKSWAARVLKGRASLYVFATLITHLLASFLMLGSIPVSMALLGPTIRSRVDRWERYMAGAVTRGYVLAALWAPGAINMYLVVQATGLSWSSLLLPGFLMAVGGMAISVLLETRRGGLIGPGTEGDYRADAAGAGGTDGAGRGSSAEPTMSRAEGDAAMRHTVLVAAAIVVFVYALEKFKIGVGYTRIMLSGGGVSLLWIGALLVKDAMPGRRGTGAGRGSEAGRGDSGLKERMREAAGKCRTDGIMKISDMGPFFVAMGIFSEALDRSGALDAMVPAFGAAFSALGIFSAAVLPLVIIGLALVGLHPFITIVMLGQILVRAGLPLTTLTIALSLSSGAGAAYMVSPLAGIIMSVARYTSSTAVDVALRWNWRFVAVFCAFAILFSLGWGAVFG